MEYTKENIQWIDGFASLEDCKVLSDYLDSTSDIWNIGAKSVHYIDYLGEEHDGKSQVEDEAVINTSRKLAKQVQAYIEEVYLPKFNIEKFKLANARGLELIKWREGVELPSHADGSPNAPEYPLMSFGTLIYLNEDYSGGEIGFDDFDLAFTPKIGSLVIFPNHMIHHVKLVLPKQGKDTASRYTLPMFWVYTKDESSQIQMSIQSEGRTSLIIDGKVAN
jgi:predicted 2-oxoglutarate/Fe(II)-dependent dioxygenase YbiX